MVFDGAMGLLSIRASWAAIPSTCLAKGLEPFTEKTERLLDQHKTPEEETLQSMTGQPGEASGEIPIGYGISWKWRSGRSCR